MVYASKELRNEQIVHKRLNDPQTWTWGKLGDHFGIHRSVAKEIFERDMEKFGHEVEIERYEKLIKESPKKLSVIKGKKIKK
jgi:hypothetical protein